MGDVVPDDVKSNLQALVKLYPTGLAVNDLKRVYAQHHKTDLDHRYTFSHSFKYVRSE